jgi:hypothetical protein
MKKIITYISVLLIIGLTSSCKKLLEESPKGLTVEAFYNTAAEVEAGLAAIYTPLRNDMSGYWIGILETHAEWGAGMTGGANFDSYKTMQGLSATGENNLIPRWNNFFLSIRNANLVIGNVPDGTILSAAQKDVYIAEARFMRAFAYFQLVRGWGGVPIHTEKNLDESLNIPRGTKQEVYDLITADLEFAETMLPENAPLAGKPSRFAAKSLLADVYFYQALYTKASDKAKEVINSGKYSLERVTVADDFNKLFGMNSNSKEEIFYLKYNQNSPSQLVLYTLQITTPWFGSNGYGVITWTNTSKFYKAWNDNDLRKRFNWYVEQTRLTPWVAGQPEFPNQGIISPKKYNNPVATVETFSLPCYRYADVLMIYAEASAQAGGPTADGVEKLNMVHRRAYGYDPMAPSPVDFKASDYTTSTFTDLVVQERAYEFQMEGKRWFDLVRSGRVKQVMKNNIGRDVADKHLLWPIPRIEFDLNKALDPAKDQNPGY